MGDAVVAPSEDAEQTIPQMPGPWTMDWGMGEYERFAPDLDPAAEQVVALAGLRGGEAVLDVSCGTGNAAIVAARAGAVVTGVDPAARLLEIARARAAAEGLEARFVQGDFHGLDFEDGTFDVVLSVFGVIFGDPPRVLPEVLRVLTPGGRALVSAWIPEGTINDLIGMILRTMSQALGMAPPPSFPWHDPAAVGQIVEPLGFRVSAVEDGAVAFAAESPEAYMASQREYHPLSAATKTLVDAVGIGPTIEEKAIAILRAGNEDPAAFRVTSRYRILEITPA